MDKFSLVFIVAVGLTVSSVAGVTYLIVGSDGWDDNTETQYLCPTCGWVGFHDELEEDVMVTYIYNGHGFTPIYSFDYYCPDCGREENGDWYTREVKR